MAVVPTTTDPSKDPITYTPTKVDIDPATDTVEGRISGIIDKNSELMQSAATTAKQGMASRGLLNSSIAIGAGQKAVIDSALPIATTDANNYFNSKTLNAGYSNDAAKLGATGQQQIQQLETQGQIQKDLQAEKSTQDLALQTLQGTQAKDIAELDNKYRVLIQTSTNAADIYTQNSASIGAILADPKLSAAAKDALVTKQIEVMNNGLALVGAMGDVDLSAYITTAPEPAAAPAPLTKKEKKAAAKNAAVVNPKPPGLRIPVR